MQEIKIEPKKGQRVIIKIKNLVIDLEEVQSANPEGHILMDVYKYNGSAEAATLTIRTKTAGATRHVGVELVTSD